MSELHAEKLYENALDLANRGSAFEERGRTLKYVGWSLGTVGVAFAAYGLASNALERTSFDPMVRLGIIVDSAALVGGVALVESGRRAQRRADTYEAALLRANESRITGGRMEESLNLIEVAIDDATMEQLAAREVSELPPHSEPQAYL